MKIMSFNVCSNLSWGYFGSNQWIEWKENFKNIQAYNNADIILLQEVYKSEPSFINDLAANTGSFEVVLSDCVMEKDYRHLYNAVLYNKRVFKEVEDITNNYLCYQNFKKNCQIINFSTNNCKLIVVNEHLASGGNGKKIPNSSETISDKHEKEHVEGLIQLENMLSQLEKDFPDAFILCGGDFNYSFDLLTEHFSETRILSNWLLDDEKESGKGVQTTITQAGLMGNAMDHFIFSPKLKDKIIKQAFNGKQNVPWNFTLGVLHVPHNGKTVISIGNMKQLSFIDYHTYISDHFPIITEINL